MDVKTESVKVAQTMTTNNKVYFEGTAVLPEAEAKLVNAAQSSGETQPEAPAGVDVNDGSEVETPKGKGK